MRNHFHTETSGENFLLFNMKISSASNAYEGKYLSQNVPLPKQNEHSQKVCEFFYFQKCANFRKMNISEVYFIK